jgi:hypothetical protein
VAVAIVVPFARRDDWLGWAAFAVIVAANVALWGLLPRGLIRVVRKWWLGRSE